MSFGLSAAAMGAIGSVAGPVVGGLMGGKGSGSSATQKQELDPRMQSLLYGKDGGKGLLGSANDLFQQQSANGGLNQYQRAGLEGQRQFLTSDGYSQGYDAMRDLGMGLLGGGVASNPFTSGPRSGTLGAGPSGGMGAPAVRPQTASYKPFSYQNNSGLAGAFSPFSSEAQAPMVPQAETSSAPTEEDKLREMLIKMGVISDPRYIYETGNGI